MTVEIDNSGTYPELKRHRGSDGVRQPSDSKLVLLSPVGDPETFLMDDPIMNTKEIAEKKVAWTIGPRFVKMSSLVSGPKTTTDLDDLEGDLV